MCPKAACAHRRLLSALGRKTKNTNTRVRSRRKRCPHKGLVVVDKNTYEYEHVVDPRRVIYGRIAGQTYVVDTLVC